jgi:hypothetical protein
MWLIKYFDTQTVTEAWDETARTDSTFGDKRGHQSNFVIHGRDNLLIPRRRDIFTFRYRIQTGSGAHSISFSMGTEDP